MKRFVWLLSVLLLVPSVSGCSCQGIIRTHFDPSTLTLVVGEVAPAPQVSISGCLKPRQTVEIKAWRSENPDLASVNMDTGVITGVAPGETTITGFEQEDFRGALSFPVTVVAPTTAAR